MANLSLRVLSRRGKDLGTFKNLSSTDTVADLKKTFAQKHSKYYPSRQWFTIGEGKGKVPLKKDEKTLESYGLVGGDRTIVFKDLGPQIAWRTVFLVEYFGPILMHLLPFYFQNLFYGEEFEHHYYQKVALVCVVLHYVKREYETVFVHRFSNGTMPIFNIFKNSAHYWIAGGIMISYFVYHPQYTAPFGGNPLVANVAAFLFLLAEIGNYKSHCILRDLRPPGTKIRAIPRGFLFEYVSCANYTCELAAWLVFAIFTQTFTAYLFMLFSTGQIYLWSIKKHKGYKKEFGAKYPKNRKALFPFLA